MDASFPAVSIIIPAYKRIDYLRQGQVISALSYYGQAIKYHFWG